MPRSHDPALNLLPAPVAVVGASAGGRDAGLTCAWLCRVSTDPPRILVAVAPERHTWSLLDVAEHFSVSVLREDQVAEGRLFGLRSGRDLDKWAEVEHVRLEGGAPALARCAARLLCRLAGRFQLGDHEGFLGEVTWSEVVDGPPSLPMRGRDWIP